MVAFNNPFGRGARSPLAHAAGVSAGQVPAAGWFSGNVAVHTPLTRKTANLKLACLLLAIFACWAPANAAFSAGEPRPGLRIVASTIDGQAVAGTLVELSTEGVTADDAVWGAIVKLSSARLASVTAARDDQSPPVDRPALAVSVVDGSLLAATSFEAHDGVAEVRLTSGLTLSLPTKQIQWVRFRAPGGDDPLAAQWAEIVAGAAGDSDPAETPARSEPAGAQRSRGLGAAAADVLVVRKKQALDYLEGVASRVSADAIVFDVDAEPVNVKRGKVEGLIYYRAKKEELPDPAVLLTVRGGTRLQITALALATDHLQLTTPAGLDISLPLADLDRLDFSLANMQFLSDLEPESFEYVSYFGGKDQPGALAQFYKPRRDMAFDLTPLRLDGKTFAKGLSMHARTKVVYRLPGKFQRLTALVGIDDGVRDAGDARLEIHGDGKMLWEGAVRGTDHAQPLDVSVAGVRRLEILTDFGGDFDAGDVIDLADAKVTR